MDRPLTFYTSVLLLLSIVAISIAVYAWRRRVMPGALSLTFLSMSVAVWLIGQHMELTVQTFASMIWWIRFEFIGIVALPVMWLWFAAEYTGSLPWLHRRHIWLLAIIPAITMLILLTNDYHSLFWTSITPRVEQLRLGIDTRYGPWFWVHVAYSYTCVLIGAYAIVRFARQTVRLFFFQTVAILIAVAVPWAVNLLRLTGVIPKSIPDLTALAFAVSLGIFAWSAFRWRLLDIRPIARDMVLQSMVDGVIAVDDQGRIIEVNRAAQELIGLPVSQILGRHAREALTRWNDVVDHYQDVTEIAEELEVDVNESRRWFNVRISPIYDTRRVCRGRLFVWRDVTEERRIREELQRNNEHLLEAQRSLIAARDAAEAGSRARGAFLAHMSHEIRTPLTAIIGYCQLLEAGLERQSLAQTRSDIEAIHLAAGHLLYLMNNVLEMAQIETGRSDLHVVPFNVADVVHDVVMTVQPLLRRNRNRLRLEGVEEAGELLGDPTRVRQILFNLVSNAAKFTTDGEVVVRIAHTGDDSRSRIQFQVSDTGPGIAPEQMVHLFEPFAIAEQNIGREQRGVGLGLAISQHYCQLMGGELTVESAPGRGTTATFWLPMQASQIALAEVRG